MSTPRLCTQCGAPLHGDTCEYCRVEYEPEHANPFTSYEVMEVTPQELREIRCREEFARPEETWGTQYCGVYDGKLIKMVPSSRKEASFEQKSTGEEV